MFGGLSRAAIDLRVKAPDRSASAVSLQKRVDSHRPTQSQMKLIINKLCCYGNKQENCSNAVNLACLGERQMVDGLVRNKDESSKSSDVTMQRSKRETFA